MSDYRISEEKLDEMTNRLAKCSSTMSVEMVIKALKSVEETLKREFTEKECNEIWTRLASKLLDEWEN